MSAADTPMSIPPPPEPTTPRLSEVERITNIFVAPSKTFADIKRNAMWIAPWLLMLVTSLAFAYTVGQRVGWEQVMQNNLQMAPAAQQERMEQIPADQKARVMAQQVMVTKGISYGFPILGLIWLVIVALVLWATFSFGAGADVKFGQSLAIVVYASLPAVIKTLLATLLLWLKVPDDFFIQNSIGTNLGYYLGFHDTPRFLYSVATALDIFTIWILVLTAIGFTTVGRIKSSTAYTVVFGWWIVVTLCGAALGAAFA
ncbi:MAG TPA: YIP1 family protein [Terriglobales bacterium]|nr:YIP1 family protein [Terriglobales bacterium]